MTSRELLRLVLRRWYLLAIGAAISLTALWLTVHRPGVYWTAFDVVLLAPAHEFYPNKLEDPHVALAPLAGVIVTEWSADNRPLIMASGDTTLFGEGRRDGVQVRVPNQGTQWKPLYHTPSINVQVVGSDPAQVELRADQVRMELDALLQRRQDALGIAESARVTTITSPIEPTVSYITGSRPRASAATALVGASVSLVAIHQVDRLIARRRGRKLLEVRAESVATPGPAEPSPINQPPVAAKLHS